MTMDRILHVCLLALLPVFSTSPDSCVPLPITGIDSTFCSKDLQVTYPEIGDVSCLHIPGCNGYIRKLVSSWDKPTITYPKAKADALYTVMIVDPDCPSRSNPTNKWWRHFLAVDVPGSALQNGKTLPGRILSVYSAPSPPKGTGYHRYQTFLYKQRPGTKLELLPEEKSSLGKWDPEAFAERYQLVGPVATTQFMAQNPQNEV